MWDAILKHLDNPALQHAKSFITDVVSSLENLGSHLQNAFGHMREDFVKLEERVAALEAVVKPVVEKGAADVKEAVDTTETVVKGAEDAVKASKGNSK